MKPENKFRTWYIEKLRGWLNQVHPGATLVTKKHADYATNGILDMSITINGVTLWVEFKYVPSCEKGRKLDVSALQRVELDTYSQAGAVSCVLVGKPLGPRLGYDVALFNSPVPEVVYRDDFRRHTGSFEALYAMAANVTTKSMKKFLET